ncbi:hypothetical protein BU26DRAFT_610297 [Trematosphaeria pertusa]|uniref:Uncharacterized protein n=1 Tax=Trematosphaeria pertusa TaxID=390896 RepID=A0A6A6HXG3_9PLEO|nr:uncharacterized protein BU26DRAFT_610297 [Trematosphaeria pertusa]KAF2242458.1 hypothetical protein BU26DRAFT_610297 [Trematosphaeria pertusa]
MCDTTFTFGQRGDHFFQCPSLQDHTRLPKKLTSFLTSSQLQKVHHITLGFENSFLITYRDKTGHDHIESRGLPPELENFLYATPPNGATTRNIPNLRLILGPYNTSFFVHDGSSYLWMNLPQPLLSALQSRIKNGSWTDKPRIVALGADGNFLLITEKHAAVWDLSHYRTISSMLEYSRTQDRGIEEIHAGTLHPYRYQCFVAQSRNGTLLHENLPPHQVAGVEGMTAAVMRDTKEAERKAKVERRPSLQQRASLTRDWGERKQEFRAQANGLRLSLSLSVSAAGIAGGIGKMLG